MKKVMLLASENMCDILQAALDDKYRTLPCSDSAAGREILQTAPDALILELSLPGADGLAFLREHADLRPGTVLVLTRYIDDTLLYDLERLGVCAVFQIPFRLPDLKSLLTESMNPSR